MTELVFQTRLSLLFIILLPSTLRRHNEQDDFAPVIHAAEFADFASNGVVGSVAHGRLCPSAYRGVPGSPSCRRIVGDTFQVRKLVVRLLGQDPPGDRSPIGADSFEATRRAGGIEEPPGWSAQGGSV